MAKYKIDSQWYRGEVISVNGHDVEIMFVDYGNCQMCIIDTVKVIEEQFIELPPQAFRCALSGLGTNGQQTWTKEDVQRFELYTSNKSPLRAKFGTRKNCKYPVRLIDDSEDGDVINSYFGAVSTNVPVPSKSYDMLPQCGQVALAWYDDVSSVEHFFLCPLDLSVYQVRFFGIVLQLVIYLFHFFQTKLDELEQFYSALLDDELVETEPRIGLPCVVRFKDDSKFYRSVITNINDQTADVLFVDFGNSQSTPLSEIRRIAPQFVEFPQLVRV